MKILSLVGYLLIAVIICWVPIRGYLKDIKLLIRLRKHGRKTIGTVIKINDVQDADGALLFRPTISFLDDQGNRQLFSPKYAVMVKPSLGTHVPVLYDMNMPHQAIVYKKTTVAGTVFIGVFLLLISTAVVCFIISSIKAL